MRLTVYSCTLSVSVILASILAPLVSHGLTEGPYTYEVANGEAIITSVNSDFFNSSLNIPATLGGYPLTQIGDDAFNTWENENITAITIPDTVTYIADWAFTGCQGLRSIALSSSVTNIGYNIFWACDELTEITVDPGNQHFSVYNGALYDKDMAALFYVPKTTEGIFCIPDTVVYFEYYAFQDCVNLTSISISSNVIGSIDSEISGTTFRGCLNLSEINVSPDNQRYSSADGVLYNKDKTDLIKFPQAKTDNVNIPDGVEFIAEYAFDSCSGLREVTVPDSVTRLGRLSFINCTNLTTVMLGFGIDFFQSFEYVFSGCTMLSAIHVSNGNPYFSSSNGVLFNKTQTTLIQHPGGRSGNYTIPDNVIVIGSYAFRNCTSLTSVTICNSVTSIGYGAFSSCTSLTSMTIPDSVTSIGDSVFVGCSNLRSITIGSGLETIGSRPFSWCPSLTVFYVSADNLYYSVDSTYGMLFNKTQTTLITCPNAFFGECILPETVTSIGDYAFETCHHLTAVTASPGLTSIGERAFKNCSALESVLFMGNPPNLGDDVFDLWRTPRATVYHLPGTAGWTDSFGGLSVLPYPFEFAVENGCVTITAYSGSENEYLKVPSFIGNHPVTAIGDAAFYGNENITALVIPDGVVSIGRAAFAGCTGLETVVWGKDVAEIETRAFYGCSALSKIYARGNMPSLGISAFTDVPGTLYYLPGATGWQDTFGTIPAQLLPYAYTVNADHIRIDAYLGNSEHVIIPESIEGLPVTEIGESAFEGNVNLVSVVFPDSVSHIGEAAFLDCLSLVDITLPNSLTSIGDWAFAGCDSLTTLFVGYVQTIGDFAFAFCPSLTEIYFSSHSAPAIGENIFAWTDATIYYASFSENWPASLGDRPVLRFPFSFVRVTDGIAITRYTGPETNAIVVPATIGGVPVTVIAERAFYQVAALTSITLPDTVFLIEYAAFSDCAHLQLITLGSSLHAIGGWAFANCKSLSQITIPDTVLYIDDSAFYGCTNLQSVILGSRLESIGGWAFGSCSSLSQVTIPANVTNISSFAFTECSGLTAIDVDNENPVYSSLDGVLFDKAQTVLLQYPSGKNGDYMVPEGVIGIQSYAFFGSTGLTSVAIGSGVISILDKAFSSCINLTEINVDFENPVYSSANGVLFDKARTSLVCCPAGVAECTIPASVIFIENGAFSGCAGIMSIAIPDSVTSIGDGAFWGCTSLTSVTIPDSVISIGSSAFSWCTSLTSVTIPDSVSSIGDWAFSDCTSLTSVTIGNSVASIGIYAFSWCTSLTSISISDSVTSIGDGAFQGCTALTSVVIGNAVTSIGSYAFLSYTSLTSVYFSGNPPTLGSGVFSFAPATIYYLPDTTGWTSTYGGLPTAPWLPDVTQTGRNAAGDFTLSAFWASGQTVRIEAATRLVNPDWTAIHATTIPPSGTLEFTDTDAASHPARFYRIVGP